MIITADEARKLVEVSNRKNSDISKTQTIMKNIKARATKGLKYFEYMAHVNYAIAKTLIESGFKLYHRKIGQERRELSIDDFRNDKTYYGIKIEWSE